MKTIEEALDRLIVRFAYTKANGELRFAIGTRNLILIPDNQHPSGNGQSKDDGYVRYYDYESEDWRMFKEENVAFYISSAMTSMENLENILNFHCKTKNIKDVYAYKCGYYYSMLNNMEEHDHNAAYYIHDKVETEYGMIMKEYGLEKSA